MADEKIVFEVDVTSLAKALGDSQTQLEIYKRDMEAAIEANGRYSEQANLAAGLVAAQTKAVQQQTGAITRLTQAELALGGSINEIVKSYDAENKSVDQNRKTLNALTTEYIKADKAGREKLAPTIKNISDELKKQEGAIGDTRRNVGNYKEAFVGAFSEISSGIPALQGFGKAQQGVNAIMSANPIGGVVTLLFALKDIFQGNAEVADQLEFAFAGVNKVFSVLVDFVVDGVKQLSFLGEAFEKPGETIKKLGELLQQNLLNRFKALGGFVKAISQVFDGDFSKAAETASNATLQFATGIEGLGTKIKGAYEEGSNAAKILDNLNKTIGLNELAISKNNIAINKNKELLAQKGKDDEVRKKAAQEIIRLEEENSAKRVSIAQTELKALEEKLKGRTLSGEQELEKLRAEAKIEQETADGIAATRKAKVEIEKLLNGESVKAETTKNDTLAKLQDEFLLSERQKIEKSFTDKEALIPKSEVKLLEAINTAKQAALDKFDLDAEAKRQAQFDKNRADIIAAETALINEQLALNQALLTNELKAVDLSVASEQDKANRKIAIQLDYLNQQLTLAEKLADVDNKRTDLEKANIDKIKLAIEGLKKTASAPADTPVFNALGINQEELKKAQETLQVMQTAFASISQAISAGYEVRLNEIDNNKNAEIAAINASTASEEEKSKRISSIEKNAAKEAYEITKQQFETNKAVNIVTAIINTALAITSALATSGNIYAGIALSIAAAVSGAAQIAIIASQKPPSPPKFADGVIGLDGAGNETSDSIDARLSKGESVLTAKATRKYHRQLAYMEMSVGNKPNYQFGGGMFAGGFIPSVSGDGGFLARETIKQSDSALMMSEAIRNGFALAPAPVLSIVELNTKQRDINRSVNLSEA